MNLLTNIRLFAVIGVFVAVILVVTALLTVNQPGAETADDVPTPTPSPTVDPSATPTATVDPSATPTETLQWSEPEQVIDAEQFRYSAVIVTNKGEFTIELDADVAPNTVNSFVFLAQNDYFDGVAFHRIVSNFVIQGGDPTGTGTGGPGYTVQEEPNEVSNTKYTVAMAKSRGATSFGSQFFINLKDNTTLDYTNPGDKFYPFGRVTEGTDVVDLIGQAGSVSGEPTERIVIEDVRIVETPKG